LLALLEGEALDSAFVWSEGELLEKLLSALLCKIGLLLLN
jgi:hypothetical protein